MSVRPRRLVHRGVVDAAGLLARAGDGEKRRVIALLTRTTRVFRTAHGVALVGDRRVDTRTTPGAALVRFGTVLSAFPLDDDELRALAAPAGSLVVVRGGDAEVVKLDATEDPSTWIDPALTLVEAMSLGVPPPAPTAAISPPTEVRAAFGSVAPKQAKEAAAVAAALRASIASPARASASTSEVAAPIAAALAALAAMVRAIALVAASLRARPSTAERRTAPTRASSRALAARPAAPSGPSIFDRLRARLADLAARALLAANLARLIGMRQSQYLREMVDMFDRGDFDDALRRAIPLGGNDDGPSHQALTVPTPRADLAIRPDVPRGAAAMSASDLVLEDLRKIYRRAFEQLDRRGEIDKAAFVLAELLRANDEAVAYLERHERYRLAAEIAEARALAPGLVVRLWFLAKDWRRATAIARRDGAFADAVVRLERSHPAEAQALRLVWADLLASGGDYAGAIVAAGTGPEARPLVRAFIERALDAGGPIAARLLARRVTLSPELFTDSVARAAEIFATEGIAGAGERAELARALVAEPEGPGINVLARPAVRATLRDRGDGLPVVPDAIVNQLLARAGDEFRADAPALLPRSTRQTIPIVTIGKDDVGATPAWDAAPLGHERTLVALGEAGVVVLARDGRVLHLFDEPAHALVMSDNGDRALALAHRGEKLYRVARLDLVGRRSEPWTEVRLARWARSFDGGTWLVDLPTVNGELATIDCLVPRFETLSRLVGLGAPRALLRPAPDRALAFVGEEPIDCLDVAVPALRLARRTRADQLPHGVMLGEGAFADIDAQGIHTIAWAARPSGDALYVRAVEETTGLVAQIDFGAATRLSARLTNANLTACDDRGRVIVIDLAARSVLRSLRV